MMNNPFNTLLTRSPLMESVVRSAQLIAQTHASVLITGESGTGKELMARAIHQASPRAQKPFISINCAALPEALVESLLFGHRKGAFTGADKAQQGLFAAAQNGTLFLDEIGELPLSLQPKLLRFLESGEILPLGESQAQHLNVRVLAATHCDLIQWVQNGRFRADLYYRLNIVPVELPALRERKEDIALLSQHFLSTGAIQHQLPAATFTKAALQRLTQHSWQGNVRELRNLCERLSILLAGQTIDVSNLPMHLSTPSMTSPDTFALPSKGLNLEALELDLLKQALERTHNNRSQAARLLGISRDAINYRLKKYAL
ncbi:MAG: hypothetical protein RLZZ422_2513 [Pseudomonadota bacterium]